MNSLLRSTAAVLILQLTALSDPFPKEGARHAEVTIKQLVQGGALASGGFYGWAPTDRIPAGETTISGISMPTIQTKWDTLTNPVFIQGSFSGLVDGSEWEGMIEYAGTYSFTSEAGGRRTVYAFKVSASPDPVAAYRAQLQSAAKRPGGWMFDRNRGNPLEQKAKR